ncbi:MAG: hypothetical protein U1F43_24210 [Myxococcota bacterium]
MRVRDELAWELVRDEWELLLAIGSGPTGIETAAKAVEAPPVQVERRVKLLEQHGLVTQRPDGFSLVPAFYERREGMSSYVRDLVLRRLQEESAPPLAGRVRLDVGGAPQLAAMIARGEAELFPAVVDLANRPESEKSRRFSVFFAAAECPSLKAGAQLSFKNQLLEVLKAAATERSLDPEAKAAYLWVAEMRVDPDIATEVGELFDRFLDAVPSSQSQAASGTAVFAVLPAARR